MTAGDRFQEGQLVGRYRIVQLIGEGGMGAVYEAIHPGLKKRVERCWRGCRRLS